MAEELKPCPFCGKTGLDFDNGSTHRWGIASCSHCGATCGEIRREYPDTGAWHERAISAWNTRAASAQSGWRPIAEAPTAEHSPFLVYLPRTMAGTREVHEPCVVQVSRFEGQLYPDAMSDLVDWDDRITKATHYMPIPAAPHGIERRPGTPPPRGNLPGLYLDSGEFVPAEELKS